MDSSTVTAHLVQDTFMPWPLILHWVIPKWQGVGGHIAPHTPCDGQPGFHLKKKLSTHCRLKCSQLFPIPVKFVQWPKSTWLWFQMASSHPAAHYWTTGCFKDRKSWIKTLYHLLPMKYWFCSLRAFNWCLGDIYFSEDGSGGHIVSLLHLLGCNNSMWISKLLGEVDVLVSVIQWTTCPSNLITPQCLR